MKALIIANGTLPSKNIVRKLAATADIIICADGGANHARVLGIRPDVILGDLDSISQSTKQYFRHTPIFHIPDQETTDLEKALEFALRIHSTDVMILGGTGSRLDHTLGTIGCFKKYGAKFYLTVIDTTASISLIKKSIRFSTVKGEKISLIPLERCTGVTTTQLKYPLKNEALELGVREGIGNEATGNQATVKIKSGTLLLSRFF